MFDPRQPVEGRLGARSRGAISVWLVLASCVDTHASEQTEHDARPPSEGGASDAGGDGGVATLAFTCPPQRAMSNGDDCVASAGFAWTGAACKEIVCGCEGEDCSSRYESQEACEADHGATCRPPVSCARPWYECNEVCPGRFALLGGGRSFGECDVGCRLDLELSPAPLATGGCNTLDGTLIEQNADGSESRVEFRLTPAAWEEATHLSLALAGATLPYLSGCTGSGCAQDVGSAWISRRSRDGTSPEQSFYDVGDPPALLRPVDQFVQGLIDQVRACRGPALLFCRSRSTSDGPPPPRCGFDAPIGSNTCECSVGFEDLGSLDGTPCSLKCASCNVPDSSCGARCVQPCTGADPVWSVWCTE